MGGAEGRQPGRGSPCPHFIIPAVLSLALPAGERRRPQRARGRARERARERARAAAHHALLGLHGAGHGVPFVPEQHPRLQTHRPDVNHSPGTALTPRTAPAQRGQCPRERGFYLFCFFPELTRRICSFTVMIFYRLILKQKIGKKFKYYLKRIWLTAELVNTILSRHSSSSSSRNKKPLIFFLTCFFSFFIFFFFNKSCLQMSTELTAHNNLTYFLEPLMATTSTTDHSKYKIYPLKHL